MNGRAPNWPLSGSQRSPAKNRRPNSLKVWAEPPHRMKSRSTISSGTTRAAASVSPWNRWSPRISQRGAAGRGRAGRRARGGHGTEASGDRPSLAVSRSARNRKRRRGRRLLFLDQLQLLLDALDQPLGQAGVVLLRAHLLPLVRRPVQEVPEQL